MDIVLGSWAQVSAAQYLGIGRGLEKESLRVQPDAALASTPHPVGLGAALTHPHITTDFSEAQIELITGVHASAQYCIDELVQVQHYTLQAMGSEVLWASSMPCTLPADAQIPLGQYGSSNTGRLKTVYRAGLGLRYGRRMQTISGIHYNWSLPETSNEAYFGLIRNFRRHSFVLLYLFGASPAVCSSFVQGRAHQLQAMNAKTMYLPYATSLRMGRLGYQSDAQAQLAVSYNSLQGYAASLEGALTQPYPAYATMGVRAADGTYQQLADSLLQIENEFYGVIRPKRVIDAGERPLHALRARGVQYVEVRLLDLNPFEPVGISAQTLRFLDVFLLLCLRSESPLDSPQEIAAMSRNQQRVAERGREPGLALERAGQSVPLLDWAQAIIQAMQPLAAQLDAVYGNADYSAAVQAAERALLQPQLLPSAQVLEAITGPFAGSFLDFTAAQSLKIKQQMLALAPDAAAQSLLRQQSQDSVLAQRQLEAADNVPFEAYLEAYLSPQRLLFSVDGL